MFDIEMANSMSTSDFDSEVREWFCESSSIPMVTEWKHFDLFKHSSDQMVSDYDYWGHMADWRARVEANPIFQDLFEGHSGKVDTRTNAQVIFDIVDRLKELILDGFMLSVGVSFGKDSSFLVVLVNLAYSELVMEGRRNDIEVPGVILHGDTLVENPEINGLAAEQWNQLMDSYNVFGIPMDMVLARPNFGSSFLGRVVGGRGLPTMVTTASRECSTDYKVKSNKRAFNSYLKGYEKRPKVCLLLGSRDEEGSLRAASIAKNGGVDDPLAVTYQEKHRAHVAYPIKDMKVEHIWELLVSSGRDLKKPIPSLINFERTIDIYADSSGECVMFDSADKDKARSNPCGSRHGCFICTANGPKDKSMTEMLKLEKYDYMKTLSRIREYIIKDHWNWDERGIWGRGIDKYGYARLQPDTYSFKKTRTLLKAMLTADVWERERAFLLEEKLLAGEIPRTADNVRMSKPQFQLVTKEDLLKIDYLWSFHQHSPAPFEALKVWDEVNERDDYEFLEWVDDMEMVAKTPIPPAKYIYVGKDWSDGGSNPGLVDYMHEMVAFEPSELRKPLVRSSTGEAYEVMHYSEGESLTVEPERAWLMFNDVDRYLSENETGGPSTLAALSYLRDETISLKQHASYKFNQMAQRYQWYRYRRMTGDMTMEQLTERQAEFEQRAGVPILTRAEYLQYVKTHCENEVVEEVIVMEESLPLEVIHFQADMFSSDYEEVRTRVKSIRAPSKRKAKAVKLDEEQLSMF